MPTRPRSLIVATAVAVIFGLLTIMSGVFGRFGEAKMGALGPSLAVWAVISIAAIRSGRARW